MKIGVHGGGFHADEATSCFLLRKTKEYADAEVVRTQDKAILDTCDIVCDVGGEYDHERRKYDHHQRGYNECFSEEFEGVRMCSCGQIWKHYGIELIERYSKEMGLELSDEDKRDAHKKTYINFFHAIDATDNGIPVTDGDIRYFDRTTLSMRVDRLNPQWNEEVTQEQRLERFLQVSELCGSEFECMLRIVLGSWLPAKRIVVKAMPERFEYDKKGRILVLESYCPYDTHVRMYEKNIEDSKYEVLYVVFYNNTRDEWNGKAFALKKGTFFLRKAFPEAWRSLRDGDLARVCGVEGSVFCHTTGFLVVNHTKEGAIKMCQKAVDDA